MSILTSILLILSGLALLFIVLRARPSARIRRLEEWEERKLEIAGNICRAAARNAFDVELDGSIASIDVLDHLIEGGWPQTHSTEAIQQTEANEATATPDILSLPDEQFVMGSYLGETIVRHLNGEWRVESELHRWPYVYFSRADLAVSPFELVQKKFESRDGFELRDAIERLEGDIDRRTNVRATTWHNAGDEPVTFGETPEADSENNA
jgi:hypothetical protein